MWRIIAFLALASALSAQTKVIGGGPKFDANGNLPIGTTVPPSAPTGVRVYADGSWLARPTGNRTVFMGDSITGNTGGVDNDGYIFYGFGWPYQATLKSKGAIHLIRNAGISGNTTSQMLARFATDVLAYTPDKVVIAGGTNDPGNSILLATTKANLEAMVRATFAAGAEPILCTIPPHNAQTKSVTNQINLTIRNIAQAYRVRLVDMYAVLVDPANGNYLSAYDSGDGAHPNPVGHRVMADKFLVDAAAAFGAATVNMASMVGDTTNLLTNPLFLTDAGGGTPSWWTTGKGGTLTAPAFSLVADAAIKGNWFQIVFPAGTTNLYYVVGPAANQVPVTAGHRIAYSGRIQIAGIEASGGALIHLNYTDNELLISTYKADLSDGVFYGEMVVPAGWTSLKPSVVINPGPSGAVTVKLAQMSVVDLTAAGLAP